MALDLPGFGEAPLLPGVQAPWLDVLNTLDALAIDRATLVGCSFGGAVALITAVTARERVSALVLASAPAPDIEPSPRLQAAWDAEETALERGDIEGAVAGRPARLAGPRRAACAARPGGRHATTGLRAPGRSAADQRRR